MNSSAGDNESSRPAPGPLNGVRVLDISTVYAAPITAMLLGDYGADVLKIEHPRGDPARAHRPARPWGPPTVRPFGLAAGVAGLAGAIAVLLALYPRAGNGGHGQVIDVSLIEPLLTILGPGPSAFDQLQIVPGRHGNRSPHNAPRNTYLTRDGRWVAISASATPVAERVMRLVGRPDIAEKPWFGSPRERGPPRDQPSSIAAPR